MDSHRFSIHRHYNRNDNPPSSESEAEEDEECNVEDAYDQTYVQVCNFLRALPSGAKSERRDLEGISIQQLSEKPAIPKTFRLSHDVLGFLASHNCFFWIDIGTNFWKQSRHKLHSFYVVTFAPDDQALGIDVETETPALFRIYRNYHVYVMPWEQFGEFLWSPRLGEYKRQYKGECRVDYFTTGPWVDLFLEDVHLSQFLPSEMDLSITVHQNMIADPDDELYPVFRYIKRSKICRAYINRKQETDCG